MILPDPSTATVDQNADDLFERFSIGDQLLQGRCEVISFYFVPNQDFNQRGVSANAKSNLAYSASG